MRVFFGKELRQPIHDAFNVICKYLDNAFDIKATTKSAYETIVENSTYRLHTAYVMTDLKCTEYEGRLGVTSALSGAYLGSTELQNGILDGVLMFQKEES